MMILMVAMFALIWLDGGYLAPTETISGQPQITRAADGDSFSIGDRKLRLKGIDAPEYQQPCRDEKGTQWPCGKAAKTALEKLLREPGLTCAISAKDRYSRLLVNCRTARTPDIAAAQVRQGMATAHEFSGMRDYGAEEDLAIITKSGIWRGPFIPPKLWREMNPRQSLLDL
jgi:endonuclease YncB( thermonuclease family)